MVSSYLACLYINIVSLGISPGLIGHVCAKYWDRYYK